MSYIITGARFCLYSSAEKRVPMQHVSLSDMVKTEDVKALDEESGSESCYVEVARWSFKRERWELYAFLKTMDVTFFENDGDEDEFEMSDREKAQHISGMINEGRCDNMIATLPRWEG